jgi:hypothetical protein
MTEEYKMPVGFHRKCSMETGCNSLSLVHRSLAFLSKQALSVWIYELVPYDVNYEKCFTF